MNLVRRVVVVLSALCLSVVAFADPPTVDWAGAAGTASTSLTTIVAQALPAVIGLFALMLGVGVFMRIVKRAVRS